MTDADDGLDSAPFAGEPADTRERIMQATFETIQERGFAGLSIQQIADRAGLSKSSVYHFYENKDELLLAFLDAMLDRFGVPLGVIDAPPRDALWAHLDFALAGLETGSLPPIDDGNVDLGSGRPYVELRSQGTYDEAYRDRFTEMDGTLRDRLATIIERGIDSGEFRDVDAARTAEFLLTVMLGGLFRRATSDGVDTDVVREELEIILQERLFTTT